MKYYRDVPEGCSDKMLPYDGVMRLFAGFEMLSASYLVARGVRPMALVGDVDDTEEARDAKMKELSHQTLPAEGCKPFVVSGTRGRAYFGYAAEEWVVDLFRWVIENAKERDRHDQLVGLLLGYSPRAIRDYLKRNSASV